MVWYGHRLNDRLQSFVLLSACFCCTDLFARALAAAQLGCATFIVCLLQHGGDLRGWLRLGEKVPLRLIAIQ